MAPLLPLAVALLLAGSRSHVSACTYDEQQGTAAQCAIAPVAATPADIMDAPGGAHNEGDVGVPSVFAVLSDWGGSSTAPYTTVGQVAAGAAMNYVCAQVTCKAVLTAGGNFLPAGLPQGQTAAAERFNATWRGAYSKGPALAVPWYTTGGASDWQGNISAERDNSDASTASGTMTWHYPTLWQSVQLIVPPGFSTLQVLLLDTVTLLGSMQDAGGQPALPPVRPQPLPRPPAASAAGVAGNVTVKGTNATGVTRRRRHGRRRALDFNSLDDPPPESLAQWQWLESELSGSTADWLIVIGNDPMLSAAASGPNAALQSRLLPLMQAAGASLYIGGRDPVAQHFTGLSDAPDVDVLVIGNGAVGNTTQATLLPNRAACPPGSLAFVYGETSGFITLTFQETSVNTTLTVAFYGNHGDTPLYSFTRNQIRAGQPAPPPPPGGRYGVRSGLILVLVLAGMSAAGLGWCGRAMLLGNPDDDPDPEEELQKIARAKARAKMAKAGEHVPLLDPTHRVVSSQRFNTFSL